VCRFVKRAALCFRLFGSNPAAELLSRRFALSRSFRPVQVARLQSCREKCNFADLRAVIIQIEPQPPGLGSPAQATGRCQCIEVELGEPAAVFFDADLFLKLTDATPKKETAPRYIRPEGITSYLLASPRTSSTEHLTTTGSCLHSRASPCRWGTRRRSPPRQPSCSCRRETPSSGRP